MIYLSFLDGILGISQSINDLIEGTVTVTAETFFILANELGYNVTQQTSRVIY